MWCYLQYCIQYAQTVCYSVQNYGKIVLKSAINNLARCLQENNPEVNYSPTRISGGCVSRGNIVQHTKRDENRYLEREEEIA